MDGKSCTKWLVEHRAPWFPGTDNRRRPGGGYVNIAGHGAGNERASLLNGRPIGKPRALAKQIAFNCVPQIDEFQPNGYTKEEMKMHWETRKIFADERIRVNATAVRVPVFYGHSEAVHVETRRG